jgi:hypothetical protein
MYLKSSPNDSIEIRLTYIISNESGIVASNYTLVVNDFTGFVALPDSASRFKLASVVLVVDPSQPFSVVGIQL